MTGAGGRGQPELPFMVIKRVCGAVGAEKSCPKWRIRCLGHGTGGKIADSRKALGHGTSGKVEVGQYFGWAFLYLFLGVARA